MGRDVGRDEGREQAEWRDLVARLELEAPVDPKDAPWPDRENLRTKTEPGGASSTGGPGAGGPGAGGPGAEGAGDVGQDAHGAEGSGGVTAHDDPADGDASQGGRGSADRGRVIRPAGFTRFGRPVEPSGPAGTSAGQASEPEADLPAPGDPAPGEASGPTLGGPRDYELDEPGDDDLDEDGYSRYIPPPLPPQPGLDPVAKGAWLALFGGPGYLLVATLLNWQIAGWAALASVFAFITGFVVLVFRLGDGPSKRDGPDQGAVV